MNKLQKSGYNTNSTGDLIDYLVSLSSISACAFCLYKKESGEIRFSFIQFCFQSVQAAALLVELGFQ